MTNIASLFFRFDRFLDATPIGNGNINDTYRLNIEVAGEQKSVLLQRLNHLVFKQPDDVMENTLQVSRHLSAQDYSYQIAEPLPGLDGFFLQNDLAGNFWRVFSFLENSFAPEGTTDAFIAYEAARAYGAFARALHNFPAETLAETIPGFHDTDRRWEAFLKVLKEDPAKRAKNTQPEIEVIFAIKPIFDKISYLKKSGELPLRVAHNDTKASNVLFDRSTQKAIAVIDLDTVMPGTLLSDFGDMVRTFAPDCSEDAISSPVLRTDILDALKRGFLEETERFLSKSERENLMLGAAWMVGEQALRFLTDWLAGDVYYKINSPEHNLVRARNQLALLGAMNGK
jgi:Ser/Thr protein kinase RdoA (MazF antagonist)